VDDVYSQIPVEQILSNLWIILFLLLFLVPMAQRNILQMARKRLLVKLGKRRGSLVITLIHRQEVISLLGLPLARYIDIDDSEEVLRAIRSAPKDVPIDIILHTPGGLALAATQIALALKNHPARTSVIIPHYAMSGGTLIALAVDEIIMDPNAALGPVDPQLGDQTGAYPATSILKVVEKKKIDEIDDKTLILAEEARKAVEQMKALLRRIVCSDCDEETVNRIIEEMVSGKYTHDHPFLADDLRALLGDRVKTDCPPGSLRAHGTLQDGHKQEAPGVEYVPMSKG
jgi:Periplasmic serine proteases (ClpP class)